MVSLLPGKVQAVNKLCFAKISAGCMVKRYGGCCWRQRRRRLFTMAVFLPHFTQLRTAALLQQFSIPPATL